MIELLIVYLVVGGVMFCYSLGYVTQRAKQEGRSFNRAEIVTLCLTPVFWLPLVIMAIGSEAAKKK